MVEDEMILKLFFQRSQQAVRELDDKYGKSCYRLSYRIVGDRQDAEECVNDSYLGAWQSIPPERPCPLLPYLLKIVRNISLKLYWKKNAVKRRTACQAALEEVEGFLADSRTPEGEVEVRELARLLERFLDSLTPENRVIFLRRYWFLDSYREIAVAVGLTEKNVSVRLARTRRRMKEYLVEQEVLV